MLWPSLQNTLSIVFGLGRSDAEWAARHFGRFEEFQIKHAVADPEALNRTHPVFFSIPETFDRWTTALEDLAPREAYVKRVGGPTKLRTLEVRQTSATRGRLSEIIDHYRRLVLRPATALVEWDAGSTPQILQAGHARRVMLPASDRDAPTLATSPRSPM